MTCGPRPTAPTGRRSLPLPRGPAAPRFGAVVLNSQMWVLGGGTGSSNFNDVWSSSDGTNWTEVTPAAPWSARDDYRAVVFNNQLWVLGGYGSSGNLNDVWSSVCSSLPSPFQITAITKESNDILVTWTCLGGHSYVLQSTKAAVIAGYTTNFADVSPIISCPVLAHPRPTTSTWEPRTLPC